MSRVVVIPADTRGFDINEPLDRETARAFREHGYRFVFRYVPHDHHRPGDLTAAEIAAILDGGLALCIVQHVEPGEWSPSDDKGDAFGAMAANTCHVLDVSPGTTVALDLESVAPGTPTNDVIAFCTMWWNHVSGAGFKPLLYIGWAPGLVAHQLYSLDFRSYWRAYNTPPEVEPLPRGYCLLQHEAKDADIPDGLEVSIDVNTVQADHQGGLPTAMAPDEWTL